MSGEVPSKWLDDLAEHAVRGLNRIILKRVSDEQMCRWRKEAADTRARLPPKPLCCPVCSEEFPREKVETCKTVQKRTLRVALECRGCRNILWIERGTVF